MNRLFRSSRTNRDRRDQAFCRAVIATAERKRREDEAKLAVKGDDGRTAFESGLCCLRDHANAVPPWTCECPCHDIDRCLMCVSMASEEHHPYCSDSCAALAANDNNLD